MNISVRSAWRAANDSWQQIAGLRIGALTSVAVVLVLGAGVLSIHLLDDVASRKDWVTHTVEVKFHTERLRTDFRGAGRTVLEELAAQYHTGTDRLDPWRASIQEDQNALATLVADNPYQAERAKQIRDQVQRHLDILQRLEDSTSSERPTLLAARRDSAAAIEQQVDAFIGQEAILLHQREQAFSESLRRQALAVLGAGLLAVGTMVFASTMLVRTVRQRAVAYAAIQHHAAQLEALNSSLEQRILERTDALERRVSAQLMRNDVSRILMDSFDAADDGPILEAWRQRLVDSGLLSHVSVNIAGRAHIGDRLLPAREDERVETLPIPYGLGEVSVRRSQRAVDAEAVRIRASEILADLGSWLELRRQREIRRAIALERDERSAELAAIFDQTPVSLTFVDPSLRVIRANHLSAEYSNSPNTEAIVGIDVIEFLKGRRAFEYLRLLLSVRDTGQPALNVKLAVPIRDAIPPALRHLLAYILPLSRDDGTRFGFLLASVDVSEREHARERLTALTRQLLEVEESERRALARELHDDFGQRLAALKLNLQMAQRAPRDSTSWLGDAVQIVDGCIVAVRERAFSLRPMQLDELGLAAALSSHVEQEGARAGVAVTSRVQLGDWTPPDAWASYVFRIVQEALRNALQHGHPRSVAVALELTDGQLVLRVRDDGVGMDILDVSQGMGGMGLLNMRERTELFGGSFEIVAVAPHGTEIVCLWPLEALAEAA
jgi:signal transduction histidine kinase/CHASE3 domain sensor protein